MQFSTVALAAMSFASAMAAPTLLGSTTSQTGQQNTVVVHTVNTTVTTFSGNVTTHLTHINTTVNNYQSSHSSQSSQSSQSGQSGQSSATKDLTTTVVPSVIVDLHAIAETINITTESLLPIVTGGIISFAIEEVEAIAWDLKIVHHIVWEIEAVLTSLVTGVLSSTTDLLSSEIHAVLILISPLVNPLLAFVTEIVGTLVGQDELVSDVLAIVGDVEAIVASLLSPVTGLIAIV